jgi:hypothetical protein
MPNIKKAGHEYPKSSQNQKGSDKSHQHHPNKQTWKNAEGKTGSHSPAF